MEYPKYYESYVKLVDGDDIVGILEEQMESTSEFLSGIPEERGDHSYADGKWSIKEVLGHLIDCERIFAYRALTISRKDKADLPGFSENEYIDNGNYNERELSGIIEELRKVRESNLLLFKGMTDEMLDQVGRANNGNISVRAILYIIAGHGRHHIDFLKKHYL